MATRAEFFVERKDGQFDCSMVMYDGYPSMVIPVLLERFKTKAQAALIGEAGDFEDIKNPIGSSTGNADNLVHKKLPSRHASCAEYGFVFRGGKWYMMVDHDSLLPIKALEKK